MIAMIRTKYKHVTIATTLFIHKTLTTRNACISVYYWSTRRTFGMFDHAQWQTVQPYSEKKNNQVKDWNHKFSIILFHNGFSIIWSKVLMIGNKYKTRKMPNIKFWVFIKMRCYVLHLERFWLYYYHDIININ